MTSTFPSDKLIPGLSFKPLTSCLYFVNLNKMHLELSNIQTCTLHLFNADKSIFILKDNKRELVNRIIYKYNKKKFTSEAVSSTVLLKLVSVMYPL